MNGCSKQEASTTTPLGTIQTLSFPPVSTPALAMDCLNSALHQLKSNPPPFDSGIIRLQVHTYVGLTINQ